MATKIELPKIDSARVKAAFANVGERAKTAREQVAGRRAELAQFNKDNLDALKAAGRIVVDGAKPIANDAVANTRKQLDSFGGAFKDLKGKKPAELIKQQRETAKASFAVARDDTKAFGQSVVKLANDVAVPLKSRIVEVTKRAA